MEPKYYAFQRWLDIPSHHSLTIWRLIPTKRAKLFPIQPILHAYTSKHRLRLDIWTLQTYPWNTSSVFPVWLEDSHGFVLPSNDHRSMDLVERLQPPSYTSQRGGLGWCNSRWVEWCGDDKPVMWGLDHDIRIPMKQPGFNESKARFLWLRWRWLVTVGFLLEKVGPGSSYKWSYTL